MVPPRAWDSDSREVQRARTYVQPFALRALGVARADVMLLDQAAARFRENGLDWRVDETLQLRNGGRLVTTPR